MSASDTALAPPKLLADAMLGKLARWLRLLGYDTRYVQAEDAEVAYRARAEGRVLLTRDRKLAQRRGLKAVLITSQSLSEQLVQVVKEIGLPPEGVQPRCMQCNEPLEYIPHTVAQSYVPPYVARTQRAFLRCPKCGKIYWKGTHWQGIERQITHVQAALHTRYPESG